MLQEARDIVKKARAIIALVFYYFLFIFINLETLNLPHYFGWLPEHTAIPYYRYSFYLTLASIYLHQSLQATTEHFC